jgi:uncharacterized membrane protein HdeD (DUF308 family)
MAADTPQTGIAGAPLLGADFGELHKHWGWLMAVGILSVVLGMIGLGMSVALTLVSVLFFGVLLAIGGAIELVQSFKARGWKSIALHVLIAVLHLAAGVIIIMDPLVASSILTLLLAGAIAGGGIARIVIAIQHRETSGWVLCLFSGLVSLVLGGLILSQWPVSGLWVIGLFVAIELIFSGFAQISLAMAAKASG